MKTIILSIAMCVIGFTTFAQMSSSSKKGTIVLVHGAWADVSAWAGVTPELQKKGYEVIAVNLPGHGKDTTPFAQISFKTYVDVVKEAIGSRTNVILVGHSMAGLVISQVAEEIPTQISKLIYVAGFLPKTGESLLSIAQTDAESHAGKYLQVDKETGSVRVAKEGIVDVFVADAPSNVQAYVKENFPAEPLAPLATPVTLTEANFGSVKKVYVHTLNDHVISIGAQRKMVTNWPVSKEYELPSSHTPFISMPGKLAAIILQAAK
jgi:pimeloyl-ACP methyl ester carboxylesterase